MKKKYIVILTFFIFIFLQPMTVYADMGPKPCIYFAFENIGDRTIYASLYALEGGPSPVSSGNWRQVPEEIKQTFLNYSEKEEARFVEDIWIINEENPRMACGYMPPEKYKLVVLGVTTVFSVLFAVFMNLIHVLIGFIQAYVFMLLSTIFIGLARVRKVKS